MFRHLRTRLTVLYAALFGAILVLVSGAVYSVAVNVAERQVKGELASAGTVFDRVWSLRGQQLRDSAGVTSRDFGFRAAVATRDEATIASALDNLKSRLDTDAAFMIGLDGRIMGGNAVVRAAGPKLFQALSADEDASGVLMMAGAPYQIVTAPIQAPTTVGWVVFASRLDRREMTSLERLSAIPLSAQVLARGPGGWLSGAQETGAERAAIDRFVAKAAVDATAAPQRLTSPNGASIALTKSLPTMDKAAPAVLLLRYPLALALAPYRLLLDVLAVVGFMGLVLLSVGSWVLARSVTRPISELDDAARRLTEGEDVHVAVRTKDEIGRLAERFNLMAAGIRDRERKVNHLAMHDHDTGMPNRLALEKSLAALLTEGTVAVAALGVDRFSHVRGAIGYGPSSSLIREVGRRLATTLPSSAIARLSADTIGLAFLAEDIESAEDVIAALLPHLEQPVGVGATTVDVALTTGLALYPLHADTLEMLVDRASIAMDQARAAKRRIAAFDAVLYGDPSANLSLMSEMLHALATDQMELHYQPKYDMRRNEVTGVEALIRWNHPVRGRLGPDLFIGMAEETGHIRALTDWVLRKAINDQKAMAERGCALSVAINVSGRLIGDLEFAAHALSLVEGACGPLCFEITETAVIDNPELALSIIDRFAAAGVAISIDDYGSGLSSLGYLKQIRANELKIDKQFVLDLEKTHNDALLIRSTIDLAHSLGLKVTAEGVETETAMALLAAMGCDQSQGYFIARPMPLLALFDFMDAAAQPEPTKAERARA